MVRLPSAFSMIWTPSSSHGPYGPRPLTLLPDPDAAEGGAQVDADRYSPLLLAPQTWRKARTPGARPGRRKKDWPRWSRLAAKPAAKAKGLATKKQALRHHRLATSMKRQAMATQKWARGGCVGSGVGCGSWVPSWGLVRGFSWARSQAAAPHALHGPLFGRAPSEAQGLGPWIGMVR